MRANHDHGQVLYFFYIVIYRNCLTSFATEFVSRFAGPSFPFMLHGSAPGYACVRTIFCTQGTILAKGRLITVEGKINEILPSGRFGTAPGHEHRIIAYTAGKMRRHQIRPVIRDYVHIEMTPYDLTKGRIIYRERTPGQGPSEVRQHMVRR